MSFTVFQKRTEEVGGRAWEYDCLIEGWGSQSSQGVRTISVVTHFMYLI